MQRSVFILLSLLFSSFAFAADQSPECTDAYIRHTKKKLSYEGFFESLENLGEYQTNLEQLAAFTAPSELTIVSAIQKSCEFLQARRANEPIAWEEHLSESKMLFDLLFNPSNVERIWQLAGCYMAYFSDKQSPKKQLKIFSFFLSALESRHIIKIGEKYYRVTDVPGDGSCGLSAAGYSCETGRQDVCEALQIAAIDYGNQESQTANNRVRQHLNQLIVSMSDAELAQFGTLSQAQYLMDPLAFISNVLMSQGYWFQGESLKFILSCVGCNTQFYQLQDGTVSEYAMYNDEQLGVEEGEVVPILFTNGNHYIYLAPVDDET